MALISRSFGVHADGSTVEAQAINAHGLSIKVMTHGASLMRLVPDGQHSLVLGFDNYQDYVQRGIYFGAIVGRYANRNVPVCACAAVVQQAVARGIRRWRTSSTGARRLAWTRRTRSIFAWSARTSRLSVGATDG